MELSKWSAPESTYRVDAHCTNCGHKSQIEVAKGTERPRVTQCPLCGCNTFKTGW